MPSSRMSDTSLRAAIGSRALAHAVMADAKHCWFGLIHGRGRRHEAAENTPQGIESILEYIILVLYRVSEAYIKGGIREEVPETSMYMYMCLF